MFVFYGVWAMAATAAMAETTLPLTAPQPILQAPAPIYSRDNTFVILSSAVNADYRLPVLKFADELRGALAQIMNIRVEKPEVPIIIMLGDLTGETNAVGKQVQDVLGHWREQIEIGDPEHVDLNRLRVALTRALIRVWLTTAAGPGGAPTTPPDWFLRGLGHAVQRTERQAHLEAVLILWSRGRIPPMMELLAPVPVAAFDEPALPAVLITWMSERESGGERMRKLWQHLVTGGVWNADTLLHVLWSEDAAAHIDEDWDRWLVARKRLVLEPGLTTAGMLSRFRLQLAVFPADHDVPLSEGWRARSLSDLLPYAKAPWIKRLADAQIMQLRAAAIGRDGTLYAVAEAYIEFLTALAQHEPAGVLQTRLLSADRLLQAAEAATASGKTLREPLQRKKTEAGNQGSK